MNPPKVIHIGPFDFHVRLASDDEMDDRGGDMKADKLRIRVGDWHVPGAMREVLLHEILHASYYAAGIRELDEAHEEGEVRVLAPVLLAILRHNPELIAYLTETDK